MAPEAGDTFRRLHRNRDLEATVLQGRKAGAGALAMAAAGLIAAPSAQGAAHRHPVAAFSHQLTRGASDQGAVPKAQRLSLRVYLAPKGGQDALKAAVAAVSDPSSASYHRFLTPA